MNSLNKVYVINRSDFRGNLPFKYFAIKENAVNFVQELKAAFDLWKKSENPEEDFELIKEFDKDAIIDINLKYTIEELSAQ